MSVIVSGVQPYMYEPESDTDGETQEVTTLRMEQDVSEWCSCGNCSKMTTQPENKCCMEVDQPSARKFCLICQNSVDAGNQYSTNCSHTMHKDCVSVWLKTSKNNSCPFCPSK